jgi:hypothetical protein
MAMSKPPSDFVAMGTYQCPICLVMHSHNRPVLIGKTLKLIKEEETFLGFSLCEEHENQEKEGYVFVIGLTNEVTKEGNYTLTTAPRSGKLAAIKKDVARELFEQDIFLNNIIMVNDTTMIRLAEMAGANYEN